MSLQSFCQDEEQFMNHLQSKGQLTSFGLYKRQDRMRNSDDNRMTQYYSVQHISLRIFKYTASQTRVLNDYSGNVNITLFAFG